MSRRWFVIVSAIVVLVALLGILPVSAAPTPQGTVYTVQPGDTLYSIARRYGVTVQAIVAANGIVNPNHIYVGHRLIIPTGGGQPAPPRGCTHIVQPGENLTRIALRYGVSTWAIAQANNLANINYIYVGQVLAIPGCRPSQPSQPSLPSTFPGPWTGEYFDNISLSGTAYITRTDAAINFNWDYGPPAGGMPTNAFSVRWTGTFSFGAGTYRFYVRVDDGARLYVDDVRLIDGWRDGAARTYTFDQGLTAGNHTVKVEYYDRLQVARIHVWWQALTATTPTPGPSPTPTTTAPTGGWLGQFYNNETLEGTPVLTRTDPWIGFDWGTGSPAPAVWSDGFSVRWTQRVHFDTDHYRICAMSDDGVRIWVGGTLVVDEWHPSSGLSYCRPHWIASGDYDVKVEYYEHGGNALIYVWWEPH